MVLDKPEVAVGFGGRDQGSGLVALAAVDVGERRGGLEVGTGEAGVGVGAVLLWWSPAVAVGEAGLDSGHVVFGELRLGGDGGGVVGDALAVEGDPVLAVFVEGLPDGGVVEAGVAGGHLGAGVAEESLNDMLGDAVVDEAGPEGVTKLVRGDGDGFAGLVVETDVVLPANEAFPEGGVAECPVAVRVRVRSGEQHGGPVRPAVEELLLLEPDGFGGGDAERDELLGRHFRVVVAQAWPAGAVIDDRVKRALRILGGSDGVEEGPVGFPGVEQRPDPVVVESSEPEGNPFDAFDEIVHGFGRAVGDPCVVPVDDLVMPTTQGAAQPTARLDSHRR